MHAARMLGRRKLTWLNAAELSRPIMQLIGSERSMTMLDEASFKASDLMTRDVAVVHPETSLADAVTLMASRHISGVPVVDDGGNVIGMLCEGDLIRWHEQYGERELRWLDLLADGYALAPEFLDVIRDQRRKVRSVMSSQGVITVGEQTPRPGYCRLDAR